MPFTEATLATLNSEIDPELVSTRSQSGSTFIYLEGFTVIDQANEIFGYDAWNYRVDELKALTIGERTVYQALVTVEVSFPGEDKFSNYLSRQDVGIGIPSKEEKPDAHEVAIKGAVTDAMKRAFRSFGNQFGNSLYDKDSAANEAMKRPRPQARPAAQKSGPAEPPLPCDEPGCTNKIVATISRADGGKTLQPSEVAKRSREKFNGKALCRDHMIAAAAKAA